MTISNINRLDQFKLDCKIINLKYEYTGYKDDVQWAIVTELSEEEILQKYPEEIKPYIPFIRLSVSQGEVFEEGTRYDLIHIAAYKFIQIAESPSADNRIVGQDYHRHD